MTATTRSVAKEKRRGPGESSISYRDKEGRDEGRYCAQTPSGRKKKAVYGKTFEETRTRLNRAIRDRDGGLVFGAEDLTIAEYLTRRLRGPAKKNLRPSTYARYEQCSRLHLIPELGRLKIKKLTALHLEDLYDGKHPGAGKAGLERCMVDGMAEVVGADVPVVVEVVIGDTWADKEERDQAAGRFQAS